MKRLLMIMILAGGAMMIAPQLQTSAEAAVYRYRGGGYGGGYYGGRGGYYGGRAGYYGNPYRGGYYGNLYRGGYGYGNRGFYGGRGGAYIGNRNFGVFIR